MMPSSIQAALRNNVRCEVQVIDDSAIAVFESFLGLRLPEDYRKYLAQNTGERPAHSSFEVPGEGESSVQYFFPLLSKTRTETLPYKLKLYADRMPEDLLPIGADPGGNVIALAVKGKDRGGVFFWDHEQEADDEAQPYWGNLKALAPNFAAFIARLR